MGLEQKINNLHLTHIWEDLEVVKTTEDLSKMIVKSKCKVCGVIRFRVIFGG